MANNPNRDIRPLFISNTEGWASTVLPADYGEDATGQYIDVSAAHIREAAEKVGDFGMLRIRLSQLQRRAVRESLILAGGRLIVSSTPGETIIDGQMTPMPLKEYGILRYLGQFVDQAVPWQELYQEIWGHTDHDNRAPNTLRVHMNRIRGKLGDELGDPTNGAVRTVRNIGYIALSDLQST